MFLQAELEGRCSQAGAWEQGEKQDYIYKNPVKPGYVDLPEHWRYSSARSYLGLESVLPVVVLL